MQSLVPAPAAGDNMKFSGLMRVSFLVGPVTSPSAQCPLAQRLRPLLFGHGIWTREDKQLLEVLDVFFRRGSGPGSSQRPLTDRPPGLPFRPVIPFPCISHEGLSIL